MLMTTLIFSGMSRASPSSSPSLPPDITYLPDQAPQENFVELTLNEVDKIKVPLPDGAAAGRVSLVDNPTLSASRGLPQGLGGRIRQLFQSPPPSELTTDQNGRPMYHLEQGLLSARSGPHSASCIFITDRVVPRTPPSTSSRDRIRWQQAYLSERSREVFASGVLSTFDTWVSEVLCVTIYTDKQKVLVDPLPPILAQEGRMMRQDHVPVLQMEFMKRSADATFTYALAKLSPDDNRAVEVDKATLFYPYSSFSAMECRAIESLNDRLVQGRSITPNMDYLQFGRASNEVFAFYCDDRAGPPEYLSDWYMSPWEPGWTNSVGY